MRDANELRAHQDELVRSGSDSSGPWYYIRSTRRCYSGCSVDRHPSSMEAKDKVNVLTPFLTLADDILV